MRWIILALFLTAFTPIYNNHDTQKKVDDEFANTYQQGQPRNFRVLSSTPNLNDLQENEVVIVSSTSYTKIMFRAGQEIYSINVSCSTVRR